MIFPMCGLTYADCLSVAGMNQRAAAKKLGVSERQFYSIIKKLGMGHWYPASKPRSLCITKEQVVEVAGEGYTRRDAAFILGISPAYLKDLVHKWQIQDAFTVTKGRAAWVTRRGYCN